MHEVFKKFSELLKERIIDKGQLTTEDSVRYTFYHALLSKTNLKHFEVIMEYPYDGSLEKLDTLITGKPEIAIEFKFTKKIPSQRHMPRTYTAGSLFKDISKITSFKKGSAIRRIFVFLTDSEMAGYLRNPDNGLNDFFNLPVNNSKSIDDSYINSKAKTFSKSIGIFQPVKLTCLFSENLNAEFFLRIYEIFPFNF